jgi:hypothetical protein
MKYYTIEPEVAGGMGKNTLMNRDVHPPSVSRLHYHFDGWLGDVLLESFPCFIVTDAARNRLQSARLSGVCFDQVEITTSEQFKELHSNRQLPTFVWLRVDGKPGHEDFGSAIDGKLVVSENALVVLRELGIAHALVTEFGR